MISRLLGCIALVLWPVIAQTIPCQVGLHAAQLANGLILKMGYLLLCDTDRSPSNA